jgi:hypothetical protein
MNGPDEQLRCGLQTISDSQLIRALECAELFPVRTAVAGEEGQNNKVVILEGTRSQIDSYLKYLVAMERVCATYTMATVER